MKVNRSRKNDFFLKRGGGGVLEAAKGRMEEMARREFVNNFFVL